MSDPSKIWKRGHWVKMQHAAICDVERRGVARYILYQTNLERAKEDAGDIANYLNEREDLESRAIKAEAELKEERTALGYIMLILETNDPMKAVAELRAERDELKALLGRVKPVLANSFHTKECSRYLLDVYEVGSESARRKCICNLSAIQAQIDGIVGEWNV